MSRMGSSSGGMYSGVLKFTRSFRTSGQPSFMGAILCLTMLGITSMTCILCKEFLGKANRVGVRKSVFRTVTASQPEFSFAIR